MSQNTLLLVLTLGRWKTTSNNEITKTPPYHLSTSQKQSTKSNRSKTNAFYIALKQTRMVLVVNRNQTKWRQQMNMCERHSVLCCIVAQMQPYEWFYVNRKFVNIYFLYYYSLKLLLLYINNIYIVMLTPNQSLSVRSYIYNAVYCTI